MTSSRVSTVTRRFGPLTARDPDLEVLLTDGLGGFALSSLAGVPTRCYSGLAVSHVPPVARWQHLVSPLEVLSTLSGDVTLHALEIAPGVFEGEGLTTLSGAALHDLLPSASSGRAACGCGGARWSPGTRAPWSSCTTWRPARPSR